MSYRKEIDGLRGIAVLSVILFHAGFGQFKGGFLGVDIFFVISGYLITSIILESLHQNKFSFRDFYIRRVRRIFPALIAVLSLSIVPAWIMFFPDQMKSFSTALGCSAIFIANIFYMNQSGYFAPNALEDPLIHLWTLSIEEQFYLLSPAIIFLAWKFARPFLVPVLCALLIASATYGIWQSFHSPDAVFFSSIARAWELLIGVVIAALRLNRQHVPPVPINVREILCLGSFFGILYCLGTASEHSGFPSLTYFLITLSTATLLFFSNDNTIVGRLLCASPLVHIGLISYSAYLWHQPILAFARVGWNPDQSPLAPYFIVVSIIFFAHLSWKFIEQPFRGLRRAGVIWLALGSALALFAFGLAGNLTGGFKNYRNFVSSESVEKAFEDVDFNLRCEPVFPGAPAGTEFCSFGSEKHPLTIAIFGDSHSFPLRAVFDVVGHEQEKQIVHNGLGGCPPLLGVYVLNGNDPSSVCYGLVNRQIAFVKAHHIKDVFLAARWSLYTDGSYWKGSKIYLLATSTNVKADQASSREAFRIGLANTIKAYGDLGVRVHFITQAPMQLYDPKQIYRRWHSHDPSEFISSLRKFSVPFSVHEGHQKFVRSVFKTEFKFLEDQLLDLDSVFCDSEYCMVGSQSESYYRDDDHLSGLGALKTKSMIVKQLQKYD